MKFISIGPNCDTADILIKANIRLEAYPFDYIYSNLYIIKHCIDDNFKKFLNNNYYKEYYIHNRKKTQHVYYYKMLNTNAFYLYNEFLNIRPSNRGKIIQENNVKYDNIDFENVILKERPLFFHHDLLNNDIYHSFYKRCNRFMKAIENDNICFVYYNKYYYSLEEIFDFCDYIKNKKNIKFYSFVINQSNDNKEILYEKDNSIVYQNYDFNEILDILTQIM